jgi:ABC-2 type transport system permease protein
VLSGLGFLWLSGHVTWGTLPLIGVAILAGASMFLAAGIVFFSLPFWLARTESVSRQLWELLLTFALYPEPLFGGGLRLFLYTALPAGFVSYLPVRVVTAPSASTLTALIVGPAAYLLLARWVFRLGLRRYASGSRFVVMG